MKKILIIGSPGSGKSTLARRISEKLHYPILHLDRIFHIDNTHQRSREELKTKIKAFVDSHDTFIIDGNYIGTLAYRMEHVDTVIIMDFPTQTCLANIEARRISGKKRSDMAPGFDNSVYDEAFVDYVRHFKDKNFPQIVETKAKYPMLTYYTFRQYPDIENFIDAL